MYGSKVGSTLDSYFGAIPNCFETWATYIGAGKMQARPSGSPTIIFQLLQKTCLQF